MSNEDNDRPAQLTIPERLGAEAAQWKQALKQFSGDLRVSAPAFVKSFDATKQTVSVQMAVRERVVRKGVIGNEEIDLITDVPIVLPRAGGFALTMPIQVGSECLMVFGDRCIDDWYQSGKVGNQLTGRHHDLSDGFAVIGAWSQPNKITSYSTGTSQFRTDDASVSVEVTPNNINHVASAAINATCANLTTTATGQVSFTGGSNVKLSGGGSQVNVAAGTVAITAPNTSISGALTIPGLAGALGLAVDGTGKLIPSSGGSGGGGGLSSINSDTTPAQHIVGSGSITVSTVAGTTTIGGAAAAQVNSDWNAVSGVAQILNRPPITVSGTTMTITGMTALTAAGCNVSATGMTLTGLANAAVLATDATGKLIVGTAGSFTPGGDLAGSTATQTVVGLRGKGLDSATIGTPSDGWVIYYDGTSGTYKAKAPGAAGSAGSLSNVSAAVATNTINSASWTQTWNWALTGTSNGMVFGEASAGAGTGAVVQINGLSNTVTPLDVEGTGSIVHFGSSPLKGGWLISPAVNSDVAQIAAGGNWSAGGVGWVARATSASIIGLNVGAAGAIFLYGQSSLIANATFAPQVMETIVPAPGGQTYHILYASGAPYNTIFSGGANFILTGQATYDGANYVARATYASQLQLTGGGLYINGGTTFTANAAATIPTFRTIMPIGAAVADVWYYNGVANSQIFTAGGLYLAGQTTWNGSQWIAQSTAMSAIGINVPGYGLSGGFAFIANPSSTIGSPVAPSVVASISSNGTLTCSAISCPSLGLDHLTIYATAASVWGLAVTSSINQQIVVYSPNQAGWMTITMVNSGHPTFGSTSGWVMLPAIQCTAINCNNVITSIGTNLFLRATAGVIYFDMNTVVFTVDCQTTVRYVAYSPDQTRYLTIGTANGGNPTFFSSTGTINSSALSVTGVITATGNVTCAGLTASYGHRCVAGVNGTLSNWFNIFWNPSSQPELWIDTTKVGLIACTTPAGALSVQALTCTTITCTTIAASSTVQTNGGSGFMVGASGTGSGYLQINNNGQTGRANPWIYSSTGIVEMYPGIEFNAYSHIRAFSGGQFIGYGANNAYYWVLQHTDNVGNVSFSQNGGRIIYSGGAYFASSAAQGIIVFSPSQGQYLQISCLTGGSPTLWSNTAQLYSSVSFAVTGDNLTTQGAGGIYVWDTTLAKYWKSYNPGNGSNPTFFASGGVLMSNCGLTVTSDYRIKKNVRKIESALSLVMKLRPVSFDYTDNFPSDGRRHSGFIAHEFAEVMPNAVHYEKDEFLDNGDYKPQGINIWDLIPVLTKAIQELSNRLDEISPQLN